MNIPNTAAAADAIGLLLETSDLQLVGHCQRSYRFAMLLATHDGVVLDNEALYVGTLLHDVGLVEQFSGPERFEVRGANAIRSRLLKMGWTSERANNVWDVIALHASTQLAAHKSVETRYANRGISVDIRGAGVEHLDPVAVRDVLDEFPRAEFPEAFCATIINEVRRNPSSARLSWLESVAVDHVPGYEPASFLAGLRASIGFH